MLIGRDRELAALERLLGEHRLVTIVGPGGVGKTTLAREVASSSETTRRVLFAELAALGPSDLGEAVAGDLGFASLAELTQAVSDAPTLMVLDNCEHLAEAAGRLALELLAACPQLTLLATSREPLAVPGEHLLRLAPLSTEGRPSPAARLFLHLVEARGLEPPDPGEVEELCATLDGLPLALELAASRMPALTPSEIRRSLAARLDLLSRSRALGPTRHRSMVAAVGWSHELLDEPERSLLRRLSVFGGPFNLQMAHEVAAEPSWDLLTTTERLHGLVERSMLTAAGKLGTTWYRMLAPIRLFARERLEQAGESAQVTRQLQSYLLEAVRAPTAEIATMTDHRPAVEVRMLFRTLRPVLGQAGEEGDEEVSHGLAAPLWWLEDLGHQAEAAEVLARIVQRWPPHTGEAASRTAGILACLQRVAGRPALAADAANRVVEQGQGVGLAYAHRVRGLIARFDGDFIRAQEELARAAEAARGAGHPALALETEMHAAISQARAGDWDGAVARGLELAEQARPHPLCRTWLRLLTGWLLMPRHPEQAAAIAREELPQAEEAEHRWAEGTSRLHLGVAALLQGEPEPAGVHLAASLQAFQATRNRTDIVLALLAAAVMLRQAGDEPAAAQVMSTAVRDYGLGALGPFESEVFSRLGDLPDPAGSPIPVGQLVQRLAHPSVPATRPPNHDGLQPLPAGGRRVAGELRRPRRPGAPLQGDGRSGGAAGRPRAGGGRPRPDGSGGGVGRLGSRPGRRRPPQLRAPHPRAASRPRRRRAGP